MFLQVPHGGLSVSLRAIKSCLHVSRTLIASTGCCRWFAFSSPTVRFLLFIKIEARHSTLPKLSLVTISDRLRVFSSAPVSKMTQHCPPKPVNESTGIMEWSEGLWKVLRTGTCLAVYATSPFKKWMDSQANENLSLDS